MYLDGPPSAPGSKISLLHRTSQSSREQAGSVDPHERIVAIVLVEIKASYAKSPGEQSLLSVKLSPNQFRRNLTFGGAINEAPHTTTATR